MWAQESNVSISVDLTASPFLFLWQSIVCYSQPWSPLSMLDSVEIARLAMFGSPVVVICGQTLQITPHNLQCLHAKSPPWKKEWEAKKFQHSFSIKMYCLQLYWNFPYSEVKAFYGFQYFKIRHIFLPPFCQLITASTPKFYS